MTTGDNSTTEALNLQAQLIRLLSSARLVLRKWASNCNELTNLIQDVRLPNASLSIHNTVKTLRSCGLQPQMSSPSKSIHCLLKGTLTKTILFSKIAKTFDPLGWLFPITNYS
ncbi:hypothetical protein CDAR_474061 [Caerostris darwini]|uniref:Uncharacterized protein n=1 Tax=Caerostris darwini TaxID=1538125 RepID=A0AAV4SIT3_9ARAC|nr:hypothetical protein CDAR_474061 [Caerostris darwini]